MRRVIDSKKIPLIWMIIGLSACAVHVPASSPGIAQSLSLCPGINVSNAPPHDRSGRVKGFSTYFKVNQIRLARAPVMACLSSAYGSRDSGAGSFHQGIDLFTKKPVAIVAAGPGRVASVSSLRGYGRTVIIDHGRGVTTRYAHLSSYKRGIKPGTRVKAGDIIGRAGASGNATAIHLHYEVRVKGQSFDPLSAYASPKS